MSFTKPIFYLHIPKTGGQTLATRLASAYDLDRIHILKDDIHHARDAEAFSELLTVRDFIESHVSGPVLRDHLGQISIMTTVRNPVERMISSYRHIRREPRDRLHRAAHILSPEDFFTNFADIFANHQSSMIAQSMFDVGRNVFVEDKYHDWLVEHLCKSLEYIDWLIPSESIDDFTDMWSLEAGRYVPFRASINKAPSDDTSDERVRRFLVNTPELYSLDIDLWVSARRWFEKYKRRILTSGQDKRISSIQAFDGKDCGIWLSEGWWPALRGVDVTEWWAGPSRVSEVLYKTTGSSNIIFDVAVLIGVPLDSIRAYCGSTGRLLTCRQTTDGKATLEIDMTEMPKEGVIKISVPEVFSPIQFSRTDTDYSRKSFASTNWRFKDVAPIPRERNPETVKTAALTSRSKTVVDVS